MSVQATQLETWIGSEVRDEGGEKVGKVGDVYYLGSEALAIDVKSGLGGRKHHAAVLLGATVTRESVLLAIGSDALVSTGSDGLTKEEIAVLADQDGRLGGLDPSQLEGYLARKEREEEQAKARAEADKLAEEARKRGEAEEAAAARARDAQRDADEARRKREEAEKRAEQANKGTR